MEHSQVAFTTTTELPFDEAVRRCREELAAEGFGVLTEIDVRATLKAKLGVEREPYLILGACNPPAAHKALTAAPEVGVLLPCNVTVSVEEGRTVLRAMNPRTALPLLDSPAVTEVAEQVGAALERVLAKAATRIGTPGTGPGATRQATST
jgi:uncharacterized protein (DUF302 family)